jgi:O-antigen/teichoic acid export membrane protein
MSKGSLVIIAGRVLQVFVTLLSVRLMTTLLEPAELGNYYLIFTILSFFAMTLLNPVGSYLNRRTHLWVAEQTIFDRLLVFALYLLLVCLLTAPSVCLLRFATGFGSSMPLGLLVLFVMTGLFCTTWNQVVLPLLNMIGHRTSFVVFSTLTLVACLGLSVVLVWHRSPTALSWLFGQAAAQLVVGGLACVYFYRVVNGSFSTVAIRAVVTGENLRHVLRFAVPVGATTLLMWLQNQSYRLIVEQRAGLEALAMIGLGLGIASNIAASVESIVHQLYMPQFYQGISDANQEERAAAWNRMAQLTLPLYISLALFVSCLAPFLVNVLAHGKFAGAWIFVVFGAWIELCRMTNGILVAVAHAEMQTGHLVKSYLIGGVLAVAGVWLATGFPAVPLLIPFALLASAAVATGFMYNDMRMLMRTKVGIRTIRRSMILSLPFVLALPFANNPRNLAVSVLVVGVAGCYFLAVQYLLTRPLLRQVKS